MQKHPQKRTFDAKSEGLTFVLTESATVPMKVVLPRDVVLGDGQVLPAGSTVQRGFVLPAGTTVPYLTPAEMKPKAA